MKILELDLIAFGPFTNGHLDLREGFEGFHLIYGPNEAGKSSTLRAVRNFFYGIPERTPDDFVHPYGKMRIGATLRNGAGAVLRCIRRKAHVNTLRGQDDAEVLDESVLRSYIAGLDKQDFSNRFGIDHDTLVQGGREIFERGGELASVLFAAGSGLASLRSVQEGLRSEMDALFKPNASKPAINEWLRRLGEEQKRLRQIQLPGSLWEQHDRNLRDALDQKRRIQEQLERKEEDYSRLERISKALPAIGRRKSLLNELDLYSSVVILPHGFSEKRQNALTALRVEEQNKALAIDNLTKTEKELAGLLVPHLLIEYAGEIERIQRELGSITKAAADRPGLVLRKDMLLDQARQILAGLRRGFPLEQVEELHLETARQVIIRKLGVTREKFLTKLENALEKVEQIGHSIEELEKEVQNTREPPDLSGLKSAIDEAKRQGRIEEELAAAREEIVNLVESASAGINSLGLWTGTLRELENLSVPDPETINDFDTKMRDSEAEVKKQEAEIERLDSQILEIGSEIEKLRIEQDVPTEHDLMLARQRRDGQWKIIRRLIRKSAQNDTDPQDLVREPADPEDLPAAFERSIQAADETADRLRRETGRVEHYARLMSEQKSSLAKMERAKAGREKAIARFTSVKQEWIDLWATSGLRPESPGQMRRWAERHRRLVETAARVRELELKAGSNAAKIETLSRDIMLRLTEVGGVLNGGESFSRLISYTERLFKDLEKSGVEREKLKRSLAEKRLDLRAARIQERKANSDLEDWKKRWKEEIQPLGLDEESIPDQANAVLDQLQALFTKWESAGELRARIEQIDADAVKFEEKVREILKVVSPGLARLPVEEAVLKLSGELARAKTAKALGESLEKRLREWRTKLEEANLGIARLSATLEVMCMEAGYSRFDELQEAEGRSDIKKELKRQLDEVEQQLFDLASGTEIEDFIASAEAENPDSLESRLKLLGEQVRELAAQKSEIDQKIGEERNELHRMDGRGDAAEIAQDIQMCLGELSGLSRTYSRLKIASEILAEAMDRYRDRSQWPVLRRASEFFRNITLGSFEGLQIETDDNGDSVIAGVRASRKELVKVDGLSDGTTDQLYLALRLASLDYYLESNEPIPFILDDILIGFDNERAAATLELLAALSEKTQVIFFTHHEHLVEIAKSAIGPDKLFVHVLGS
jgi:uncharacterized protein YhaN